MQSHSIARALSCARATTCPSLCRCVAGWQRRCQRPFGHSLVVGTMEAVATWLSALWQDQAVWWSDWVASLACRMRWLKEAATGGSVLSASPCLSQSVTKPTAIRAFNAAHIFHGAATLLKNGSQPVPVFLIVACALDQRSP